MTAGRRWALLVLVVVIAVVAFVIASPGGSDEKKTTTTATPTAAPTTPATTPTAAKPAPPPIPRIVVREGKPIGGVKELRVREGQRVRFEVQSDVDDHVHVHGYDIFKGVRARGSVKFDFRAKITGKFEIELEDRHEQIAELTVRP